LEDVRSAHFDGIGENDELLDFLKNWGLPIMQTNLRVFGDSGLVGWQMAHQGLGISAMTYNIAHHFPEMKLVLPELEPIPVPSWLTTHKELHSAKRTR
jgi:DNA-binding transcriptional LysR family regulator